MVCLRFLISAIALVGVLGTAEAQVAVDLRPEKAPGVVTDRPGSLEIGKPAHARFDDAYQFGTIEHQFEVLNRGKEPVLIEQALAVAGGASVTVRPHLVVPGNTAVVVVRQPLAASLGNSAFRYALVTDEPGVSRYRFSLSGFVQSAFDPERPLLDFASVDRDRGAEVSVEIFSREVDRLELGLPDGLPDGLTVDIDRAGLFDEGVGLTARLGGDVPLGLRTETILLTTNVPHQPFLEIVVRAEVFGDIVPGEHPIDLGLIEIGQRSVHTLYLRSRSGRSFGIVSINDTVGDVHSIAYPCGEERPSPCWELVLETIRDQPGPLGGRLLVNVVGIEETVPLSYRGMAVSPGTRIKRLEAPSLPEEEENTTGEGR